MSLVVDVQGGAGGCPADASDPSNAWASELQAALSYINNVTSADATCLGCLPLAPDDSRLRWSFNLYAGFAGDAGSYLPAALTAFGSAPAPICADDLLTSFCQFLEGIGTPALASSGSPSMQQTCMPDSPVYGLVDLAAAGATAAMLSAQFVATYYVSARAGAGSARITGGVPAFAASDDGTALQLAVAGGANDAVTVRGRPFQGPTCPPMYDPDTPSNVAAELVLGHLFELGEFGFRAYTGNGNLSDLVFTLQVTTKDVWEAVSPSDIIELNWQCKYQDVDTDLCSLNSAWVTFQLYPDNARFWATASTAGCAAGAAVDYIKPSGLQPTLSDWMNGERVSASAGGAACTSPALTDVARIVGVAVSLRRGAAGPATFFVDDIKLKGPFNVRDNLAFDEYVSNFELA